MKKIIYLSFFSYFCLTTLLAQAPQRLKTLIRFESVEGKVSAYIQEKNTPLPTLIKDKNVQAIYDQMRQGSEAFVEGYIDYEIKSVDSLKTMKPTFVVESIHPVSLAKIGKIVDFQAQEDFEASYTKNVPYAPPAIAVTTELASALTLTSTLLLMESLSSQGLDPQGRRNMKQALIISGGVMATLLFIYEQLEGKTKP